MKKTTRYTMIVILLTLLAGQQVNNIHVQTTVRVAVFAAEAGQPAPTRPATQPP